MRRKEIKTQMVKTIFGFFFKVTGYYKVQIFM